MVPRYSPLTHGLYIDGHLPNVLHWLCLQMKILLEILNGIAITRPVIFSVQCIFTFLSFYTQ